MQFEDRHLWLSDHAYGQYCLRVGQDDRSDLHRQLEARIRDGEYHRKDEYIQIDGVWWVFVMGVDDITMVTCYGESNFDLPRALKWARRHGDRIVLQG